MLRKTIENESQEHPEVNRKAVGKYKKKNPEGNKGAVKKYKDSHPGSHLPTVHRKGPILLNSRKIFG